MKISDELLIPALKRLEVALFGFLVRLQNEKFEGKLRNYRQKIGFERKKFERWVEINRPL